MDLRGKVWVNDKLARGSTHTKFLSSQEDKRINEPQSMHTSAHTPSVGPVAQQRTRRASAPEEALMKDDTEIIA